MTSDASRVDVNVDYGNICGYHVSIDVDLPRDALYPQPSAGAAVSGHLWLMPDEAEALANQLIQMAQRARELQDDLREDRRERGLPT